MKLFRRLRKTDYRYYVAIIITIGFAACFLRFPNALGRLIESVRDVGTSFAYYVCDIFEINGGVSATVNDFAKIPFFNFVGHGQAEVLPKEFVAFKASWNRYWQLWCSKDNFGGYMNALSRGLSLFAKILLVLLPLIVALFVYFRIELTKENNDYNEDSKPLAAWKRFSAKIIRPVIKCVKDFFTFLREHSVFVKIWLLLWAFYFNFFTIVLEAIAYYLYFVISFDIKSLYRQVYKLAIDLSAMFGFVPWWAWIILGVFIFDLIRKCIAVSVLLHNEMKNRGFINARPIVFMVCGTMGKKKTTAITDMALSQEVMFRDKAFEKIFENDMKFPHFPWINLELFLRCCMERHLIYNLATCRKVINTLEYFWRYETADIAVSKSISRYLRSCYNWKFTFYKQSLLFDYDFERYGLTYDDKLKTVDIWEVIKNYSQLYFIYVIKSSLILSNYSIRTDDVLSDTGNFPIWNHDFFSRDSRFADSYSRHAHILDFDTLRLGKKMLEDNPNKDNFEFGVVMMTEIGKERGNAVENIDKKKKDETANPKNDGFNSWLKMVRHSATVDNYPFARVITDEQRPESWGADCRDLCDIVYIKESGEQKLAMPWFSLAELLYDFIFSKFVKLYYRYRYSRSDNTLTMYILKNITAKIQKYYASIYNEFGYCALRVQVENGTQDGQITETEYYLANKKIYSKRFATDCFSDYFTEKALRSPVGIDDLIEYVTEKATIEELTAQHSYFITELNNRKEAENEKE